MDVAVIIVVIDGHMLAAPAQRSGLPARAKVASQHPPAQCIELTLLLRDRDRRGVVGHEVGFLDPIAACVITVDGTSMTECSEDLIVSRVDVGYLGDAAQQIIPVFDAGK